MVIIVIIKIYNWSKININREMSSKKLNFGIVYGRTAHALQEDLSLTSIDEAHEAIHLWYSDKCEVRDWQEKQKMKAIESGFTHSLIGRPRKLFESYTIVWRILWSIC